MLGKQDRPNGFPPIDAVSNVVLAHDLALERGMNAESALIQAGIPPEFLEGEQQRVSADQELAFLDALLSQGADETFAFELGARHKVSAYGLFGYALMTCATVREAVQFAMYFANLTNAFCSFYLEETEQGAWFFLNAESVPPRLRDFIAAREMTAAGTLFHDFAGFRPVIQRLWVALPATSALLPLYEQTFKCRPEPDRPIYMAGLDRKLLDHPLPLANALTHRQCRDACERILEWRMGQGGTSGKIKGYLHENADVMPTIECAAAHFNMTPRTLRRRLANEGTSYRQLVEDTRKTLALGLLNTNALTIEKISLQLGYQDVTTFITAFKRWHGITPAAYRKQHL